MRNQIRNRIFFISLFAAMVSFLSAFASDGATPGTVHDKKRSFTVKDSIELSYFVNPSLWPENQEHPSSPIISPDRKWFLTVTQRGVLDGNLIESTIWLFDRLAALDCASQKRSACPKPKSIASFSASSNTPVVSDVRWLGDSKRVAFLAQKGSSHLQLYMCEITTGRVQRIAGDEQFVTSFDIQGDTVAYTTLDEPQRPQESQPDLLDVTGKSIWELLWRDRSIEERDSDLLLNIPNALHISQNGRLLDRSFVFEGRPLRLNYPVLSLSPDQRSLITIAAVNEIPEAWADYKTNPNYEGLKLTPQNKSALSEENNWKPSQLVRVDLETGIATPLLAAPAGRSLFHIAVPTTIIWAEDSRRVLVSNTFLPTRNQRGEVDPVKSSETAVAIIDIVTGKIEPITFIQDSPVTKPAKRHISDITWEEQQNEVILSYATSPDNTPIKYRERFRSTPSGWTKLENASEPFQLSGELTVEEDLNHPGVLEGWLAGSKQHWNVWDPNPQVASLQLGSAALYHWNTDRGDPLEGILVLPPDYELGKRYPLVIQTHGYEPNKFFADGRFTTGSGGRALVGKGIIVLQMDQTRKYFNTPEDGPRQVEAFESAIKHLAAEGMVDPQRVGVIGFSYTVFHVLYAVTHAPALFAAASITDGNDLSYWVYLTWADIPYAQEFGEKMNGGVKPFGREGLLRWAESAPGFNLDRVQTPLMISCLEKGTLAGMWDIYGGLRTLGKPVDMLWLRKEDAPHVLIQPRHRYPSQQSAVDWFDFWLNGHEDPDPKKAEQYGHWREIRNSRMNQQNTEEDGRSVRLVK